jgi:hypothetical protein
MIIEWEPSVALHSTAFAVSRSVKESDFHLLDSTSDRWLVYVETFDIRWGSNLLPFTPNNGLVRLAHWELQSYDNVISPLAYFSADRLIHKLRFCQLTACGIFCDILGAPLSKWQLIRSKSLNVAREQVVWTWMVERYTHALGVHKRNRCQWRCLMVTFIAWPLFFTLSGSLNCCVGSWRLYKKSLLRSRLLHLAETWTLQHYVGGLLLLSFTAPSRCDFNRCCTLSSKINYSSVWCASKLLGPSQYYGDLTKGMRDNGQYLSCYSKSIGIQSYHCYSGLSFHFISHHLQEAFVQDVQGENTTTVSVSRKNSKQRF